MVALMLGDVTDGPGVGDGPPAFALNYLVKVGAGQRFQKIPVRWAYFSMVGGDARQIAVTAVILVARLHRAQRSLLNRRPLSEDMSQIVIHHFTQVLQVPTNGRNLRNGLPGNLVRI